MVDGFTRIPVASDGNCFYTATGFFCGLNAATMRHRTLQYLVLKRAEYSIFFESEAAFIKAIKENSMARIWNTDLADILPHAAAGLLRRDIIIHNYDGRSIKQIRVPVIDTAHSGAPLSATPIHLFRSNCHYEILLENCVLPNKNIICLPDDVSDVDLVEAEKEEMKEEEEDQHEEEGHYQEEEDHYQEGIFYDVEEEDVIPEDNEEECLIHF